MHILSQTQPTEEEINCSVADFISEFHVGSLLKKCNAAKAEGHSGHADLPIQACKCFL